MSVLTSVTAVDRDDEDRVTFLELDPKMIDAEKSAVVEGAIPNAAVVKIECVGTPYLTVADLFVLAEQLRDLANKISRPQSHGGLLR